MFYEFYTLNNCRACVYQGRNPFKNDQRPPLRPKYVDVLEVFRIFDGHTFDRLFLVISNFLIFLVK